LETSGVRAPARQNPSYDAGIPYELFEWEIIQLVGGGIIGDFAQISQPFQVLLSTTLRSVSNQARDVHVSLEVLFGLVVTPLLPTLKKRA
jgi:hypothetical protein